MTDDAAPIVRIAPEETAGDRVRKLAAKIQEETDLQIKVTSRILGAAAQISENHDRLIREVVEVVEEDLERQAQPLALYTIDGLKQQFGTLQAAKAQFGVKARAWADLVEKLNQGAGQNPPRPQAAPEPPSSAPSSAASFAARLDAIEHELQRMNGDIREILMILKSTG